MQREITKVQSEKQMRNICDEIFFGGNWQMSVDDTTGLPVYTRERDGKVETLKINKMSRRQYQLLKESTDKTVTV